MEQDKHNQNKSSLLKYAISRLSPDVFSHPVWLRFGHRQGYAALNTADDLLSTAKTLQQDDPGTACQVLLLCAVYQNQAGQDFNALRTAQQALALSQANRLDKESVWALWGMCAILIQQGNHEQACTHLVDLQAALSEQNDWVLADFVDVFRQAFTQPIGIDPGRYTQRQENSAERTLGFTFDWLLHWGFSVQGFEAEDDPSSTHPVNPRFKHSTVPQNFFTIQRIQGRWHTLMLAIRGELHMQWRAHDPSQANKRFSLWDFLSSIRFHFSGQESDIQGEDLHPSINNPVLLPPIKSSPPPPPEIQEKKAVTVPPKPNKNSSNETTTFIPVAVHMLGTFSMTIGELTLRLPSSRSISLLKYLLIHHKQGITREVLMDVFWPEAEPETARNNLNVAIHSLRKALRNVIFFPVIKFEAGGYGFEPNLRIWLDVEEFEKSVQAGQRLETRNQRTAAISEYESAISLYQGDFLEQDPYEEWTVLDRERLRIAYLDTLDRLSQIYFEQERYAACLAASKLILARDHCREDAHCLTMRCYSRQGQHPLALRQYQMCVESLRTELHVDPAPETTQLYTRIRRREKV